MSALYLVKASDPVLRSRAAQALIDELLEGGDRTLVVEEFLIPTKTRAGGDEKPRSGMVMRFLVIVLWLALLCLRIRAVIAVGMLLRMRILPGSILVVMLFHFLAAVLLR